MIENLINDLLDYAKIENGQFKFDYEFYSLPTLIYEAFQIMNFSAKDRGINLRARIDSEINLRLIQEVYGDKRRMLQTIINFLSNALKFTDRDGTITVDIEIVDHQNKNQPREVMPKIVEEEVCLKSLEEKDLD